MFSFEYLEIYKNTKFEAKTLENEIYSRFFNERSHTLFTGKSEEGILKLFYSKWSIVQCKILIQNFPPWKQKSPRFSTTFGW